MQKSIIGILILSLILVGIAIPAGFSGEASGVVITYGETTYNNNEYKAIVDDFFKTQSNMDISGIDSKIITADEVNKISATISHKTYNSNQILSSALVDLNEEGNIKVTVDTSKITTITADMYISALKSAGITQGHVYVTSPTKATGESALTGIMNSYEEATNIEIPDSVKQAANDEIYTQAEIVENSNVSANDLSDLVDDVKETVESENITDHEGIVNVIYNYTTINNINISNSDIENLANSIEGVQSVQGDVEDYQNQLTDFIDNNTEGFSLGDFSLDGLLNLFRQ